MVDASVNHGCAGKVQHRTRGDAQAVLDRRGKRHKLQARPTGPLRIYRCNACGHWHIGSGGATR